MRIFSVLLNEEDQTDENSLLQQILSNDGDFNAELNSITDYLKSLYVSDFYSY